MLTVTRIMRVVVQRSASYMKQTRKYMHYAHHILTRGERFARGQT